MATPSDIVAERSGAFVQRFDHTEDSCCKLPGPLLSPEIQSGAPCQWLTGVAEA